MVYHGTNDSIANDSMESNNNGVKCLCNLLWITASVASFKLYLLIYWPTQESRMFAAHMSAAQPPTLELLIATPTNVLVALFTARSRGQQQCLLPPYSC